MHLIGTHFSLQVAEIGPPQRPGAARAMTGTLMLTHQEDAATLQSLVSLIHPVEPYFGVGVFNDLFEPSNPSFYRFVHLPVPAHAWEAVLQAPDWEFIPRELLQHLGRFSVASNLCCKETKPPRRLPVPFMPTTACSDPPEKDRKNAPTTVGRSSRTLCWAKPPGPR